MSIIEERIKKRLRMAQNSYTVSPKHNQSASLTAKTALDFYKTGKYD